jgi:D-alanyl-D-alanine carboxypeptidase/D-alanyl-D-alanine-endopeptidase (penicillin-binding protein 4)
LTSGTRLFAMRAGAPRTPASVQKLLTTSTTLGRVDPNERIPTVALSDEPVDEDGILEGDLYVKGFGDPSLTQGAISTLADGVADAGVIRVTGRVIADESYYDSRRGLASYGFRISSYLGALSALGFSGGGFIRSGSPPRPDPAALVARKLRAALVSRGVAVKRATSTGVAPDEPLELARVESTSLATLTRHTNQTSDNYFAEVLLKGLGARFAGAGTTAGGARVVRAYQARLGVSARVVDGSGLSRGNAVSASGVGRLLERAAEEPWFEPFYESLAVAGRTGTLRKRMRGTAAKGRCRGKTGTLRYVSALAGYCRSAGGHRVAFALLMNGVDIFAARRVQDRVAAALARYRG